MKNEFSLQNLNVKHTLTKIFIENSCASISNEINHDKYGIHLEPCYKQFTLILAKSKEKLPKKFHDYLEDPHLEQKKRHWLTQKNMGNVWCIVHQNIIRNTPLDI